MFEIFKNLLKNSSHNNEKYYQKIKKLTNLVIEVEQKSNNIWFQKVINNIRVTIWIENNLTTINIKIIEETDYEFSLDFDNYKYTFSKTNYDNNDSLELDIVNQDSFEENIEIIFLDIIDKTIKYFSNQLEKKKEYEDLRKEKDIQLINDLSSTIKDKKKESIKNSSKIIEKNISTKSIENNEDIEAVQEVKVKNIKENTSVSKYHSEFIIAIENLDNKSIKKYINLGANINSQDINGNSALIVSVMRFDLNLIKLLIKKDVNKDIENFKNETALSIAKKRGYQPIIDILSENNISHKKIKITNNKTVINSKIAIPFDKNEKQITSTAHHKISTLIYQKIKDDIIVQNKIINNLKNEVQVIKRNNVDNRILEDYKLQMDNFKETISSQFNEIKELQNKLILKEESSTKIIEEFSQKVIDLENKLNNYDDLENSIEIKIFKIFKNYIDDDKVKIKSLENKLSFQLSQINELKNKSISKEKNTKDLTLKINKLEKKFEKQKTVKTIIPLDIHVENKSIKKDDGVIIKRESFDDF